MTTLSQTNNSTDTSTLSFTSRLSFLDGLRAFAALWVMLGHVHLFTYGWSHHQGVFALPFNILLYMHLGVVIFLVLSGFCLTLSVVQNNNYLRTSVSQFFKARARRILPPYFASLFIILAINYFVPLAAWGRHAAGLTSDISWQVLLTNFTLMQDVFPQFNIINGPYWSISTEWHLYFLFPLIVFLWRRFHIFSALLLISFLAIFLTKLSFDPPLIFSQLGISIFSPPYFIFLFGCGIAAAWFVFGKENQYRLHLFRQYGWILCLIFAIPFSFLIWKYRILDGNNVSNFFDHSYLIDPIFGLLTAFFLIFLSLTSLKNVFRRLLENKLLTFIGGFSYSLYLIHIPVLAILHHFMAPSVIFQTQYHWAFLILTITGGGLSLLLAWGFSSVFETRRWEKFLIGGKCD